MKPGHCFTIEPMISEGVSASFMLQCWQLACPRFGETRLGLTTGRQWLRMENSPPSSSRPWLSPTPGLRSDAYPNISCTQLTRATISGVNSATGKAPRPLLHGLLIWAVIHHSCISPLLAAVRTVDLLWHILWEPATPTQPCQPIMWTKSSRLELLSTKFNSWGYNWYDVYSWYFRDKQSLVIIMKMPLNMI